MLFAYVVIWGCMILFGSSAIVALVWAVHNNQFGDATAASASIFDAGEPPGAVTDRFPEARR